jgi:hypothetical protein
MSRKFVILKINFASFGFRIGWKSLTWEKKVNHECLKTKLRRGCSVLLCISPVFTYSYLIPSSFSFLLRTIAGYIIITVIVRVDSKACSNHIGMFASRTPIFSSGAWCVCFPQGCKLQLVGLLGTRSRARCSCQLFLAYCLCKLTTLNYMRKHFHCDWRRTNIKPTSLLQTPVKCRLSQTTQYAPS